MQSVINGPAPSPQAAAGTAPPMRTARFVNASTEHVEPLDLDVSRLLTTATQNLAQISIGAFGYLRGIWVEVTATGGAGGGAVAHEDGPWSVLQSIIIRDVNGGELLGPVSGFDAMLIHRQGGYAFQPDPTLSPRYTAMDANGNFRFAFRLPVEVSARDALAAIANGNASSTMKLGLALGASTQVYSTAPATLPTIRVRAWQEDWAQPDPSIGGVAADQTPPLPGTTQYWSSQTIQVPAGEFAVQQTRLGNFLRQLILVCRTTAPARSDAMFPDAFRFTWDSVEVQSAPGWLLKQYDRERSGLAPVTGVYQIDFTHSLNGQRGDDLRELLWPTLTSSRIELRGTWNAAGTVTILTNDISTPAGASLVG